MFDLLLKNATIVDGTGKGKYISDLAIVDDRIAKISKNIDEAAKKVLDVKGKLVCPGFIDPHTHVDENIMFIPMNNSYLSQGVTTVVCGSCGASFAPTGRYWSSFTEMFSKSKNKKPSYYELFIDNISSKETIDEYKDIFGIDVECSSMAEFSNKISKNGVGTNLYPLVGHGNLRRLAMGENVRRPANKDEIEQMKSILHDFMKEGTRGLSTGLDYPPGAYSEKEELIELAKVVKKYDGVYTTHVRAKNLYTNGGAEDDMFSGINEALDIARQSGVRLQISHIDYGNASVPDTKELLIKAQNEGVDVSCDVIASASAGGIGYTYLIGFLRPWYLASGSIEQFAKNLQDDFYVKGMIRDMGENIWFLSDDKKMTVLPTSLKILACKDERYRYKTMKQIMNEFNYTYQEALINIIKSDILTRVRFGRDSTPKIDMKIREWFDFDLSMPCSDSSAADEETFLGYPAPLNALPHRNSFNAFIKYLTKYCSPRIEEAIYKATGFVSERFNIKDRGILEEGKYADVIVIDYDKLDLNEDIDDTRRYPKGIETVIVNGKMVIENGKFKDSLAGRVLLK